MSRLGELTLLEVQNLLREALGGGLAAAEGA
jgi:hypothetical protein